MEVERNLVEQNDPFEGLEDDEIDQKSKHEQNNNDAIQMVNIESPSMQPRLEHQNNEDSQSKNMFDDQEFNNEDPSLHIQKSSYFKDDSAGKNNEETTIAAQNNNDHQIEKEILNKGFDKSQEELSEEKIEIPDQLEEERRRELANAGRRLKLKMIRQERCYLCTLSFP